MQLPESWLREFCNPPLTTAELAETLTMAGLEVEEMRPVAPPFSGVVVGEIKSVAQHPNADRLKVCQIDAGQGGLLSIVCGAPNAREGIKVPCALVGATLPPVEGQAEGGQPFHIKLGKLRGVESQGMLCSAKELKLSDDHGGLLELASTAVVGQDIRAHLLLDDIIFTLKLTPNLAHCLSVYGVARELSALTGAPLVSPKIEAVSVSLADTLPVKISAPELCGRFSGRVVRFLNAKAATPGWMVERLQRCGQRSVSALVDISNYVMFELGRPTHIFDLDKIHGGLDVRWGRAGEQLKLLNGNTVLLDEKVGIIADGVQVESLAGIMGGDATAVSDETQHVYVEAAFWWPQAVAGRSRRFNFSTDAGHRFERGVDPSQTVAHIERISQLIFEICGTPQTQYGPIDDQAPNLPVLKPVQLRVSRAARILGMPLSSDQCVQALQRLALPLRFEGASGADLGIITVTPPPWRFDLQIEEDLIEELARMVGFQNLPDTPPQAAVIAKLRPESQRNAFAVRHTLADMGYQETINFSFCEARWEHELAGNPQPIQLLNPIASQMSVMRSSLLGSLLQVLKFNQDRKAHQVRVFEIGRVFLRDPDVPDSDTTVKGFHQPMRLAALACGTAKPVQWETSDEPVDFFDLKADVESLLAPLKPLFEAAEHPAMHPGRCARVLLNGLTIGHVGELHPKWRQAYDLAATAVMFELELDAVLARPIPKFLPVPKYQPVERDLAVIVKDRVSHAAVMQSVGRAPTHDILKGTVLFDIYRPKQGSNSAAGLATDEKSLALRLTLNSEQATLTEAQIESVVATVLSQLVGDLGARQRV
jgi:phenylalanyl-tRNA synthetase beta chain